MELFGCLQGCDGDLPAMHGWVQAPDLPDWVLHGVVQTASCCPPSVRAYVLSISAAPKTTRSEVHGVFLVRPTLAMDVWIDVVPRKTFNKINLQSEGTVKVAVLTEGAFDALDVDPKTARFGPNEAVPASYREKDVDRDGDKDLLLSFWIQQTGIACADIEATLTGALDDGTLVTGTDYIRPVHCK